eukprot:scaffold12.g8168.t1
MNGPHAPQEENRVVTIRFGHDWDETCMQMDEVGGAVLGCVGRARVGAAERRHSGGSREVLPFFLAPRPTRARDRTPPRARAHAQVLASTAEQMKNFAVTYLVDISEVPDFNAMYELYDACTIMFFFRNKHIMVDLGTGNNNKINWAMTDKQEFIDIVETVYRGARKGRGLVVSPKDYSTKYRY